MAKKKKTKKPLSNHDGSMSPLDFLEDECIAIMSGKALMLEILNM